MPYAPKHPCRHPGCSNLTDTGYCKDHTRPKQVYKDHRESASRRGYDSRWQAYRLRYLNRHPLCEDCAAKEKATPATEVHHIQKLRENPELKFKENNLIGLCHECHSKRTALGQ